MIKQQRHEIVSGVSSGKWYKTLKWYTQLRRMAKFRRFTIIARRNIASIIRVSGKIGYSLDDEYLDIAIIRRGRYASLLNLDEFPERPLSKVNFELRASKSLTTLVTNGSRDSNGTNGYDPLANDLSVGEKSMRMLNVTAEDVMDARSRIQERSYWSEQRETAKTADSMGEVPARFSSEIIGREADDTLRNGRIAADDIAASVSLAARAEDVPRCPPITREKKDDDGGRAVSVDRKEETPAGRREEVADFSSIKRDDVAFGEARKRARSMESREPPRAALIDAEKEKAQRATKTLQCPSSESARNTEVKPCSSLVRQMTAGLGPIPTYRKGERGGREKHPCRVKAKLMTSSASRKERCKSSRASSYACRCLSHAKTDSRSSGVDDKNVKREPGGKGGFGRLASGAAARKDESDARGAELKYSDLYRSKKRIQMSSARASGNGASPAQTARSLRSEKKRSVAANRPLTPRTSVRTENSDEERRDSSSARRVSKRVAQTPRGRSFGFGVARADSDATSRGKSRAESEEREAIEVRALKACNDLTPPNDKSDVRARKVHDPPSSRALSVEEREAFELRALRAYNRLTLLEDKKELEARRKYDSSRRSGEVSRTRALKRFEDLASLEDEREVAEITRYEPSSRRERSIRELGAFAAYRELALSADGRAREIGEKKRDSSKRAASSRRAEEIPRVPDRPSGIDRDEGQTEAAIASPETHRDGDLRPSDGGARRALVSPNLREVTRNIERTLHPRGVVLANKGLRGRSRWEAGNRRESRQRDIVEGDTTSALHGALFFRPEVVTTIFRRARRRIDESFPSLRTFRRRDLDTEFACRIGNETVERDSRLDSNLERTLADRDDPEGSSPPEDANENRVAGEEDGNGLCILFVEREEIPSESETVIVDDSTIAESRGDARSSVLVFDEEQRRADSSTNDNLPVQLLVDVLRNFGVEVLEGNANDVPVGPIGEDDDGDASNDEVSQQPAQLSSSRITSEGTEREKSWPGSRADGDDEVSRSREAESSSLETKTISWEDARSEDKDIYVEANESTNNRSEPNSNEMSPRDDDSYDSTYDWHDDSTKTPVSLENGSSMEEFSHDVIS